MEPYGLTIASRGTLRQQASLAVSAPLKRNVSPHNSYYVLRAGRWPARVLKPTLHKPDGLHCMKFPTRRVSPSVPPLDVLRKSVAAMLMTTFIPFVSAQELPREFTLLSARDLTLACTVHTTFLATTSAQSINESSRSNAIDLVKFALVWKREAAREQASQEETLEWGRRVEALSSEQIREQATYCVRHAAMMFKGMPATMQRGLTEEAERQTNKLMARGQK